ncbi:MAG: DUF933 domain-containing protein [Planctomycetota bacterium]
MRLALTGLRASGKTTLFNAATGAGVHTGEHGVEVHIGQVKVPDPRVEALAEMTRSKKVTHASVEFVDLVGIAPQASVEAKLNAQVFAQMRETDGVALVLRAFRSANVAHPLGPVDPARDLALLLDELLLADTLIVQKRIDKLRVEVTKPKPTSAQEKHELALLEKCLALLEQQVPARRMELAPVELLALSSFQLLTLRPVLVVVNVDEQEIGKPVALEADLPLLTVSAEIEAELAALPEAERQELAEEYGLAAPVGLRLAQAACAALDGLTFLTSNEKEARAWIIRRGSSALEAAAKVHTDIARGFIRAEVVSFDQLAGCGSFRDARAKGKTRLEGKDYVVQEGDVIEFRFSA